MKFRIKVYTDPFGKKLYQAQVKCKGIFESWKSLGKENEGWESERVLAGAYYAGLASQEEALKLIDQFKTFESQEKTEYIYL